MRRYIILEFKHLSVYYEKKQILSDINLRIQSGEIIGIIGPNGSGKSTLLNAVANNLMFDGDILFENKSVKSFSAKNWAKNIAMLEQTYQLPEHYSVFDIVMMGNYIHKKWWQFDSTLDRKNVMKVLESLDLLALCDRPFTTLSGGEQQRAILARIVIHNPKIILLDEPTNHLDIYYQIELLKLVRKKFQTIIAVLHDLNLATLYCDKIILLHQGHVIEFGKSNDVVRESMIKNYFKVEAKRFSHPECPHSTLSLYDSIREVI